MWTNFLNPFYDKFYENSHLAQIYCAKFECSKLPTNCHLCSVTSLQDNPVVEVEAESHSFLACVRFQSAFLCIIYIQGGPAKVRPTYIFDGNI